MNNIAKNTATVMGLFTALTLVGMYVTGEFAAVGGVCYSNADCSEGYFCEFPRKACEPPGTCEVIPEGCDVRYRPVCGCNDRVYDSDCERKMGGVSQADKEDTDDKIICCNPTDPEPLVCREGDIYWKNYCAYGQEKDYYRGAWRNFVYVLVEACPEGCEAGACVTQPPPPECNVGDVIVTKNHTCAGTGDVVAECTRTCAAGGMWGVEECVDSPEEQCGAVDIWDRMLNHWNRTIIMFPYWIVYLVGAVGITLAVRSGVVNKYKLK